MSNWRPDPRGFSAPAGMRLLPEYVLREMVKGRAGEGPDVMSLAGQQLSRRRKLQDTVERCPLWALSPYEQELHRALGAEIKHEGSFYALA